MATVVILGLLLYGGPDSWATDMSYLADPGYIPSTFALIFFAVGTHPLIVGVMHTTRSPTDLRMSILGAWPIATTVSVLCGGMAYRIYGSALQPDVMANIGGELRRIAGVWMAIKVLGNAVPLARPLANAYARSLRWLPPGDSAEPLLMMPVMVLLATAAMFFADRLEAGCLSFLAGWAGETSLACFASVVLMLAWREGASTEAFYSVAGCLLAEAET